MNDARRGEEPRVVKVVGVHGVNNQYSGRNNLNAAWRLAILDGIEAAGVTVGEFDFDSVFYGDIFRPPGRLLAGGSEPVLTADDLDEHDLDLMVAWWQEAARVDPGVRPPDVVTLSMTTALQRALAALSNSRFFANVSERMLIFWIKQVRTYFTNAEARERIQERALARIGDDTRVVVAHSLGSVVAYEALCARPDCGVTTLVTLGSPLGLRNIIFDRLDPPPALREGRLMGVWPGKVVSWTNIADEGDFVALVKDLRPAFGNAVENYRVDTGMRSHDVLRYLTADVTGAAVAGGLLADD